MKLCGITGKACDCSNSCAPFKTTREIAQESLHQSMADFRARQDAEEAKRAQDSAIAQIKAEYNIYSDIFPLGDPLALAKMASKPDPIARPSHYERFVIEPITFAVANGLNALEAKVVKYTVRAPYKDGKKDLLKARRCIDMLIEKMAREERIIGGEDARDVWKDKL